MNLHRRLILSHTFVVFLTLSIIGISVMILLQTYSEKFMAARLNDMTMPIYVQARFLAQGHTSLEEIWSNLTEQARETGVLIFMVDAKGKIIRRNYPKPRVVRETMFPFRPGVLPDHLSEPYYGTYEIPGDKTIAFAAYPLAPLFASLGPNAPEILVLALPRNSALTFWVDFYYPFLWAGLITLVVSIIVALFLARSVYLPIRQVKNAANAIAQGHYDQEILLAGPVEIKSLAQSFNRMATQVKLSQQRLRDFLTDISHELKTPLTSIRGFAQAIVDGTVHDETSRIKAARIIEEESRRLTWLVNELLELSKIESGQIKMRREQMDLNALLNHCIEVFSLQALETGVTLSADFENLPETSGDMDRLEQVFNNLIDNALKHTPSGGKVSVRSRSVIFPFIEISIIDSGSGIAPQKLARVFNRFYRAETAKPGLGLGLAIAREIVRAHGGDIEARNSRNQGAEFVVKLPAFTSSRHSA